MPLRIRNNSEAKQCKLIKKNNSRLITELRNERSRRKLKVAFLVSESTKWSCQSLFEEFDRSPGYEPFILVTADNEGVRSYTERLEKLEKTYDFFVMRDMKAHYAYDAGTQQFLDLHQFNPDLIFYQQPWYIDATQSPEAVSRFALACYVPYSIACTSKAVMSYPKTFLYGIWKHFLVSDLLKKEYESWMSSNQESLVVTGHPKLDAYLDTVPNDKHYVIYAPHFSFRGSILELATFDWSGRFLLDFAKSHKELNWVFKPHPVLRFYIIREGVMTEDETDEYYDEWTKFGTVYDQGDYFDFLQRSDALITDCSSFLSEYLPTENPVIHLISEHMAKQNPVSSIASSHYYKAHDLTELRRHLDEVVIGKNDPLREERVKDIGILNMGGIPASSRIIGHIESELN